MRFCYLLWVNSGHLEALLWVVRVGGVGAAARHLNLTQPAVTRRIQELERELGGPLFVREGRNVVPTPLAKTCVANAERILAEMSLMRIAASGRNVVEGKIRAGLSELTAMALLDRLLIWMRETYPNVVLDCDVDLSSRLLGKLARRQIDIAFVPGPVSIPDAVKMPIGSGTLLWMSNPRLLRTHRKLTPLDFGELPIISLPHDADVHWTMVKWFEQAGVQPRRISYCNNFSVVASLVRKGLGVSLLPYEMFRAEVEAGSLVVLPESPPVTKPEYSVVYLPSAELHILPRIAAFAREQTLFENTPPP
jgi:DNA-binding transcriptional LysR family regulator